MPYVPINAPVVLVLGYLSAAGYYATGVIQAACCWGYGYSVPVEMSSYYTHAQNGGAGIGII